MTSPATNPTAATPATANTKLPVQRSWCRGERGSATLEAAVLAPVLLMIMGFVVFVGRIGALGERVQTASRDAAREASIQRTPAAARTAGARDASATLADHHVSCQHLDITTDTSDFRPGGTVRVTVTCEVSLTGITGFGLPGAKTVSATSVQVIDTFRSSP